MNLTKLFIVLGIVFIATLGQTEGRRRWFKRKYKTIGCATHLKFRSAIGDLSNDHQDGDTQAAVQSHNATERSHYRKSNKWRRIKCGGNNCDNSVSATDINSNSTDTEINTHKVRRKSRISRRRNRCNVPRNWRFYKVESGNRTNTTDGESAVPHNPDGHNRRRNRNKKCKSGRKGKCQTPIADDTHLNEDEGTRDEGSSIENELHIELATTEEPILNIIY